MADLGLTGLDKLLRDTIRQVFREELQLSSPVSAPHSDGWLTVKQAAQYGGFAEATLREWCRQGRLDAGRPGGHWRIMRSSLDKAIRKGERSLRTSKEDLVESEMARILNLEARRTRG